ncbi:MAG: type II toxin-antitoxin system YafQ family toxin [Chitinophagaceae bacterium]
MIIVKFTSNFKRTYNKLIRKQPELGFEVLEKLLLFSINPYNPTLDTHKLKGKLSQMWPFTIRYDLRILFYFENDQIVTLVDIGTHNEVY